MSMKVIEQEKKAFLTGNEVVAWAALAAKVDIMYGYPITPQNEIMHYWTRLAPKYERKFLQTEDELSAGFTTLGGVMAGRKSFTATAGPGNTLMQEPMSMAEMMRLPTVLVVMQRGGPSTATVIYSQQEVTMTTFGGNGEGMRIVYSTCSHQELYDYTIKAFNAAWKYRFPTFVLGDGYQAKMREPLTLYDPEERGITLVPTEAFVGNPGTPGVDRPAAHYRNTYSMEEELFNLLEENMGEYRKISDEVAECQTAYLDDAELVVIGHGIVHRAVRAAIDSLRSQGVKAGFFRPITLRPLAVKELQEVMDNKKQILIVESSYGQMTKLIKDVCYGATNTMHTFFKPGIGVTAEEVEAKVKELLK
ncbi:MAG: ferredoxin oxidoreductase [Peptococcaceae bacterium]|nr:ferredoxin oxidoreductase [Peptococcaceae bacterium]